MTNWEKYREEIDKRGEEIWNKKGISIAEAITEVIKEINNKKEMSKEEVVDWMIEEAEND